MYDDNMKANYGIYLIMKGIISKFANKQYCCWGSLSCDYEFKTSFKPRSCFYMTFVVVGHLTWVHSLSVLGSIVTQLIKDRLITCNFTSFLVSFLAVL